VTAQLRIAIIGFGKIARDQHLPAIVADPSFELAAVVGTRRPGPDGVACFADAGEMLAKADALDAVAISTPPGVRYEIARACLAHGLHCLLEKPPGVTLGEVQALAEVAEANGVTLFTAWHAQHNPAVTAAAELLARRRLESMRIVWREDVRKWHPRQQWIWEPGGLGVFDSGINAFSIASRVVPGPLLVREAELMFPANRQMPIAAEIGFTSPAGKGPMRCTLDWRHQGEECWTIEIAWEGRRLILSAGGSRLELDGKAVAADVPGEYPSLYMRFAELIANGQSEVDLEPLRIAADIFMAGRRTIVDPFDD
jgi:D-galactose 1-dehydrogenase